MAVAPVVRTVAGCHTALKWCVLSGRIAASSIPTMVILPTEFSQPLALIAFFAEADQRTIWSDWCWRVRDNLRVCRYRPFNFV